MIETYYIALAFYMVYVCILYHVGYVELSELPEEEWEWIVSKDDKMRDRKASRAFTDRM